MAQPDENEVSDDNKARAYEQEDFAENPLKNKIGESLRQMYDDVLNEPVPDDFLSILSSPKKQSG